MNDRKRLTPAERAAELRKSNLRAPIGGMTLKLPIPKMKEQGWTTRWVNKTPERIGEVIYAGYEKVTHADIEGAFSSQDTQEIVRSNGTGNEIAGSQAILMKIPTEIWQEDQKRHAAATHEYWADKIHNNQKVDTVNYFGKTVEANHTTTPSSDERSPLGVQLIG